MSHVATIDVEIKDLQALRNAAKRIGLEFVEGQKTYRWWGSSVGDYPLPEGFALEDLGKCEHAIRMPLDHPNYLGPHDKSWETRPYEVGVVKRRDGKPGFTLLWDFFAGGNGLQEFVGDNACKLRQAYTTEAAKAQARKLGYRVQERTQTDGSIRLSLSK